MTPPCAVVGCPEPATMWVVAEGLDARLVCARHVDLVVAEMGRQGAMTVSVRARSEAPEGYSSGAP